MFPSWSWVPVCVCVFFKDSEWGHIIIIIKIIIQKKKKKKTVCIIQFTKAQKINKTSNLAEWETLSLWPVMREATPELLINRDDCTYPPRCSICDWECLLPSKGLLRHQRMGVSSWSCWLRRALAIKWLTISQYVCWFTRRKLWPLSARERDVLTCLLSDR